MLVGHVSDAEHTKIRESRLGADGGKLWIVHNDFVPRKLIRPGFNLREFGIQPGGSVFGCVAGKLGHSGIVAERAGSLSCERRRLFPSFSRTHVLPPASN